MYARRESNYNYVHSPSGANGWSHSIRASAWWPIPSSLPALSSILFRHIYTTTCIPLQYELWGANVHVLQSTSDPLSIREWRSVIGTAAHTTTCMQLNKCESGKRASKSAKVARRDAICKLTCKWFIWKSSSALPPPLLQGNRRQRQRLSTLNFWLLRESQGRVAKLS